MRRLFGIMKRISTFEKHDYKHMWALLKNLFKQFFVKMDWEETKDTYFWMKIHLSYDSERVDKK